MKQIPTSRQSAIPANKRTLKIRTLPIHGLAGSKPGAPDAGGPGPAASVRSHRDLWTSLLLGVVLAAARAEAQPAVSGDLALRAQRAATVLTNHQQVQGYWLTYYTDQARFERPRPEMNTFVTSVIIDLVNPVAGAAGLEKSLQRARNFRGVTAECIRKCRK